MGQVICMGIFNPNFYVTYVFPGQQVDLGLSVSWEGVESRGRVNLEGGKMICMGLSISSFHVEKGKACEISLLYLGSTGGGYCLSLFNELGLNT